jgi:hypothetical protein
VADFERLRRGVFWDIWITKQKSGSQVMDYTRGLAPPIFNRMRNILERTANIGKYESEEIYRHIGDGIYEFKAQTARIYSFNDEKRIVLTHGATKPKKVVNERKVAVRVRSAYLEWKKGEGRQ